MASRDALADLFQQIPLFAGCTKKDLKLVLSQAERVHVHPGQVLISEGQTGREFFMVLEGTATVSRRGRKVTTLGPGQSFGELALLDPAPRNATVTASTDMELVVLGQREFAKIVDATPGFARSLLSGMAQRVNAADSRLLPGRARSTRHTSIGASRPFKSCFLGGPNTTSGICAALSRTAPVTTTSPPLAAFTTRAATFTT